MHFKETNTAQMVLDRARNVVSNFKIGKLKFGKMWVHRKINGYTFIIRNFHLVWDRLKRRTHTVG